MEIILYRQNVAQANSQRGQIAGILPLSPPSLGGQSAILSFHPMVLPFALFPFGISASGFQTITDLWRFRANTHSQKANTAENMQIA